MSKILRYVLLAVMVSCGAMSVKADNPPQMTIFIEKCSNDNALETVFVEKELLKMVNNSDIKNMAEKLMLHKIESIGIVTADNKKEVAALDKIVSSVFVSGEPTGYVVVMSVNDDGNQTKILKSNRPWLNKNVYVIITKESDEMTVVVIYGLLTLADVSKLKL